MDYQLTATEIILRLEDGANIPPDPANIDYQQYLSWLDEGNKPEPYVAPPEPTPPTPAEKLQAAGLTIEELKDLLGL